MPTQQDEPDPYGGQDVVALPATLKPWGKPTTLVMTFPPGELEQLRDILNG